MSSKRQDLTRVILIGGSSHVGKTSFATALAATLGWQCRSTDQMSRHPGRPWRDDGEPPPMVSGYYLSSLTPQQLLDDVLAHYQGHVWPMAEALINTRISNPFDRLLVLEGSAIWPAFVAAAQHRHVTSVWLTAPDDILAKRIQVSSQYFCRSADNQRMIDRFLQRSVLMNQHVVAAASRLHLPTINSEDADALTAFVRTLAPDRRDPGSAVEHAD